MRRSSFVHTAALRLDVPLEVAGDAPAPFVSALADASVDAWDELVRLCTVREAAFLIIAGGIFDGVPPVRAQARLRRGLLRLGEQGVQVFVALGRGETAAREWFAAHDWPSSLTLFPCERPLAVRVGDGGAPLATVVGQSHSADWSLDAFLAALPAERDAAPLIAVAPCDAETLGWQRPRPAAGTLPSIDYWALGGDGGSSRQGFHPWIVEPGPLQARDGRDRHLGPRGAMVADLRDAKVVAVELIELDRVRWLRLEAALPPGGDLGQHLVAELFKLRAAHGGRPLLVDVALGGVELSPAGRRRLLAALREAARPWEPFVWCNTLRSELGAAPDDLWRRDELAAAVAQSARALLGNPLQRSLLVAERCEPLLRRWTEEMQVDQAERLIEEAGQLAVAALLAEEGA